MFFTFASKQKGGLSTKWQLRQIAFDTQRRYLYLSHPIHDPAEILPPTGFPHPPETIPEPRSSLTSSLAPSRSLSTTASPNPSATRASRQRSDDLTRALSSHVYDEPTPSTPADVQLTQRWSKKVKVSILGIVAEEEYILVEEGPHKEREFYEIIFYGEYRKMAEGATPPVDRLLCPSTGIGAMPSRCTVRNAEFVRDPFFLRELHDSLQTTFDGLRAERERERERRAAAGEPSVEDEAQRAAAAAGVLLTSEEIARDSAQLTLPSPRDPRRWKLFGAMGARLTLRFRNEYEYRRFRYVVQTVLGYDRLCSRPYRGFPPYDPRNGIVMAQIPMPVLHVFKPLDRVILYTFLRGDLVGRGTRGELTVTGRGTYLCLTHDNVIVFRPSFTILRWCEMRRIHSFEYNHTCARPYVAFLTDPGYTNIVFIPQPPVFGPDAIRQFSAQAETLRVLEVVRAAFYASLDTRRAIAIRYAAEKAVRDFVARVEATGGSLLNFDPPVLLLGSESDCGVPHERLSDAWRAVQVFYSRQHMARAGRTAIPLYHGHPNSDAFQPEVLAEMEYLLERERSALNAVVGLNEREQESLRRERRGAAQDLSASLRVPSPRSSESLDEDEGEEYPYRVPGSAYRPRETEAEDGG